MSTQQNKGSPSSEYLIENLKGAKIAIQCTSQQEWDKICQLVRESGIPPLTEVQWNSYNNHGKMECSIETYGMQYSSTLEWYSKNGYQIVQAKDVISANGGEVEWCPKIGEWVYIVKPCSTSSNKIANVAKIVEIIQGSLAEFGQCAIYLAGKSYEHITGIRKATEAEIQKATGTKSPKDGKEWICTSEDGVEMYDQMLGYWVELKNGKWEWCTVVNVCSGNVSGPDATLKNGRFKVFSTEAKAREWLANQGKGWKVGDVLPLKWLKQQQIYRTDGKEFIKHLAPNTHPWEGDRTVKSIKEGYAAISDTCTCYVAPKNQCTPLPQEQVPGTNIGRRVRITTYGNGYNGQIGVVVDDSWNRQNGTKSSPEKQTVLKVQMSDGNVINPYISPANMPECEWVNETNQIIDQTTKTNQNEHKQQQTEQDSYTGTAIICTDPEHIRSTTQRAGTPIYSGGCLGSITTGYKGHSKDHQPVGEGEGNYVTTHSHKLGRSISERC